MRRVPKVTAARSNELGVLGQPRWVHSAGGTKRRFEMGSLGEAHERQIEAALVRDKGGPFQIETLTLEPPRRDEVLIRIVATGMCHTDMVARDKVYDVPHPIVLGHEGSGIVDSGACRVLGAFCRVTCQVFWRYPT